MATDILSEFGNFKPEVWEARLENWLGKIFAFGNIVNTSYEGVIKNWGDVVRVNIVGDVSVRDYVPRQDLVIERLDSAQTTVTIDQGKTWGFITDDVDRIAADKGVIDSATKSAAYNLTDAMDSFIAGKYTEAGLVYGDTTTPIDITAAKVKSFFAKLNRIFSDNNLPSQGRWLMLPPWLEEKMLLAQILDNTNNSAFIENGIIGRYMGWELHRSSNIPIVSSTKYKILAGVSNTAITFARGFAKTGIISPDLRFESGIKGLALYGGKVLRPDFLCCVTATEGTEPA